MFLGIGEVKVGKRLKNPYACCTQLKQSDYEHKHKGEIMSAVL